MPALTQSYLPTLPGRIVSASEEYVDDTRRTQGVATYIQKNIITGTAQVLSDGSIPQISEGRLVMSGGFSVNKGGSGLFFEFIGNIASNTSLYANMSLFLSGDADAVATSTVFISGSNRTYSIGFGLSAISNGPGLLSFEVRCGLNSPSAIVYINGISTGTQYGGTEQCYLKITEFG